MKKIITAINNPILNEKLSNEKDIEVIGKDIQYKDAILEILEKDSNIDLLIISDNLPGEIDIIMLMKKIKIHSIKVIFILEKQNRELEEKLKKEEVDSIYYNNEITIDEIIKVIKNDCTKNQEDIKKEIEELKEMVLKSNRKSRKKQVYIKLKKPFKKILKITKKITPKNDKKQQKIITFFGEDCVGKTSIIATFAKIDIKKINKILIINFNEKNNDIFFIFSKEKNRNFTNQKSQSFISEEEKNIEKVCKKISILDGKFLIENGNFKEEKFKKIIKSYDIVYIENGIHNYIKCKDKILKLSDKIVCVCEPNIINISKTKKILECCVNNYFVDEEKINILLNKYNKYSIEENLFKKIFFNFNIIGKIKSNNRNNYLINTKYKNVPNKIKKEYQKILEKIIFN